MSRQSPPSGKSPALHTAIISDVAGMWAKLRWDVDVFQDIQIAYPDEEEPLAYAAINVCIAASSLKDWVKGATPRNARTKSGFDQEILAAIPLQAMCDAIANTSKHSAHSEGRWGGAVSLDWEEGDESAPAGYVLRYHHADDHSGDIFEMAVNQFDDLLEGWWSLLLSRELVTPDQRTPAWLSRKIRRIFTPLDD